MNKRIISAFLMATMASCALSACSDDDGKSYVNNKTIGSPCTCVSDEGEACGFSGIPLPRPIDNDLAKGHVEGCENVDLTGMEGAELVCLRSISPNQAQIAPVTYFPKGFCSISAVSCEGNAMCNMVAYGDVNKMTSCPAGFIMMEAPFYYDILGMGEALILDKICVPTCNDDSDCNGDGEISCLTKGEKGEFRFCYNEKNYENFLCRTKGNGPDDCSKIKYTKF